MDPRSIRARPLTRVLLVSSALVCGGLGASAVSAQQASTATTVSAVNVGAGVPVPHVGTGARMYTLDEIHVLNAEALSVRSDFEDTKADLYECYQNAYSARPNPERTLVYEEGSDAARRLSVASDNAARATQAALQARLDAANGRATQAQVEQAELDRQKTVNDMVKAKADMDEGRAKAIDIQQLVKDRVSPADWGHFISANASERASRKNPLVPKDYEDLVLENIQTAVMHDTKGGPDFLKVTGDIRNASTRKIDVPGLAVTVSDQFGYPLLSQVSTARGKIDPGKTTPFDFPMRPSPPNAARVAVTFAGVAQNLTLEPVSADPVCSAGAPPELNPNSAGANGAALPSARTMQLNAPSMQSGPVAGQQPTTFGAQPR